LVRSELYQLEKLIAEIVIDGQICGNECHAAGIAKQVHAVVESCSSLKLKWVHELFSSIKEPVLTRYIQYHQAGITSLSNQVSLSIPPDFFQGIGNQLHQFYFTVVTKLEELLQFLKLGFYKYFDKDYPVSADRCRVQAEEIRQFVAETAIALHESDIDPSLVNVLTLSVSNKLTDAKQSGISYRQLDTSQSIVALLRQKARDNSNMTTVEIAHELYRQNFNSYYFNQWYQEYLYRIINAVPEAKREATIIQEVKVLNAIFVERDKIFEPELPAINDQLLPWLRQLSSQQSGLNLKAVFKINGNERMPLQFSVTQFALFIRLCYLEGCFHVNNISGILRFFTQHFATKKQLNISFKSFAVPFMVRTRQQPRLSGTFYSE
jgi:hypothetical protein